MKKSIALLALVALVAACGGSGAQSGGSLTLPPSDTTAPSTTTPTETTTPPSTEPASPATTGPTETTEPPTEPVEASVVAYLLDAAGAAVPVERTVSGRGVARAAVEALIAGPNRSEEAAGLATAFPADSLVLGLRIEGGTAVVDMSLEYESGGGSASVLGRLAQLVYTLTEFDGVDEVRLLIEGEAIQSFSGEGVVVAEPLTRADFTGAVPLAVERPGSGAPTWAQTDLPDVTPGDAGVHRVVLVAADDFLNVRRQAGVDNEIIGRLLPGVAVQATAETATVGSSTWRQVVTPAGNGWVNGFYLTPSSAAGSFPSGTDPEAVIEELSDRFASGEEFADLVSAKGLWVAHHAAPIRFDHDGLDGILDDPTTYRWGSNALEPGSPEIQPRTFAEAVANRFVSTVDDDDRSLLIGDVVEGPNGRPPEFAIPTEFAGFPYATVFDPGDNPEYGGLDWTTWLVSFSYEGGELEVVGLTIDEWAP